MPAAADGYVKWIPQGVPWRNWHDTVKVPIRGVAMIYPPTNLAYGSASINRTTALIQQAIAAAKAAGDSIRAVGRGWSLSDLPATSGRLLDTGQLTNMKAIRADQIHPGYPGNADARAGLWLVQCGTRISQVNRVLESDAVGRSLRTTGAANGQTIVGATAAGTHGSALGFGALHDHIVAIHLIAGPDRQYWLERASRPVLKDSLPATLGAEVRRDDQLFNAVLVGLGAFGVIHNLVIETRKRFLLKSVSFDKAANGKPLLLDAAMRRVIATLDFDSHPLLKSPAGHGRPYFFQPIIDPNSKPSEVLVTLMYERPWKAGYAPDYRLADSTFGPGYDFLTVVGRLLDVFKPAVPFFAQVAKGQLFDTSARTGSWGEIFGFKVTRTKVASGSVAVPLERALATLDLLIGLNQDIGPAPLVFGCRYVAKSPALLAMNRFDTTFVVSIDGVHNKTSMNFFDAIPARMEAAGIPFTQHWGKVNGYTPARVAATFGSDFSNWVAARHVLLPDAADRALFSNSYMKARGLDI